MVPETLSLFSESPDNFIKDWRIFPVRPFTRVHSNLVTCYSGFKHNIYKKDLNYYFAFPAMPVWIEELIDELNSIFKNIKYEIVENKSIFVHTKSQHNYWGKTFTEIILNDKPKDIEDVLEYKCPVFTVKISDKINEPCRPFMYYILHHILRMASKPEGYINADFYFKRPDGSLVEFILDCNNRNRGYRSLAEINLSINNLILLDDIDKINIYLNTNNNHLTQTEIFMNLNWDSYCKIKKGTVVTNENCIRRGRSYYNYYHIQHTGELISIKKNNCFIIKTPNNANTMVYGPIRTLEYIKVDKGKFKVGDFITPKTYYLEYGPALSHVIENYEGGFVKIQTDLPFKSKGRTDIFYEDDFKRLPKTKYEEYGIESI